MRKSFCFRSLRSCDVCKRTENRRSLLFTHLKKFSRPPPEHLQPPRVHLRMQLPPMYVCVIREPLWSSVSSFVFRPAQALLHSLKIQQRHHVSPNDASEDAESRALSGVVPAAHLSGSINSLFLNLVSYLLHRVCLNELSVHHRLYTDFFRAVHPLHKHFNSSSEWSIWTSDNDMNYSCCVLSQSDVHRNVHNPTAALTDKTGNS